MSVQAEVEGLGILEFPDGTDPSVIQATVKRKIAEITGASAQKPAAPAISYGPLGDSMPGDVLPPAPIEAPAPEIVAVPDQARLASYKSMSWTDKLRNDLQGAKETLFGINQTGGRIAGKSLAGKIAMPLDAAMGVYNTLAKTNVEHPSAGLNRLIDRYIAPPPQTTGGSIGEDVMAGMLSGKLPSLLPTPMRTMSPPRRVTKPQIPAEKIIAAGEKHEVPVTFPDVSPSGMARRISDTAEYLGPLGTGSVRAEQNVAAKEAAKRVLGQYTSSAGDDVPVMLQEGMQRQLAKFRARKDTLYNRAAILLNGAGTFTPPKFNQAVATAFTREEDLAKSGVQNRGLLSFLADVRARGKSANFMDTQRLRSDIDDEIGEYFRGRNSTIGKKGVGQLIELRRALDDDLETIAKGVGGKAEKAWRDANAYYKTNLTPYKVAGFKDLVKTAKPEKTWQYLLAQGSLDSSAKRMYNALDDSGRGVVKYGLVKEAYENALNARGTFSPATYASYLEKNDNAVKTFFTGQDLEEIKGFSQLMRHVERAGAYAENPPTGQRLILPALFGTGFVGPGSYNLAVPAIAVTAGLSARALFQTKTGRDLLLRASRAKPNSPAMNATSNRIARYLEAAGGQATLEMNDADEEAQPSE